MRDEDYAYFIQKFGEPTDCRPVPDAVIEKYAGRVHEKILDYWHSEGWCQFQQGLYWSINPSEWQAVVDAWIADTPFAAAGSYFAVARDAFGRVRLFNQIVGGSVRIVPTISMVSASSFQPLKVKQLAISAVDIFAGADVQECDCKDEAGNALFKRALKKLGPLDWDEIYAFEPAIIAGGRMSLESLRKVRWDVQLMMLRELAAPQIPWTDVGNVVKHLSPGKR